MDRREFLTTGGSLILGSMGITNLLKASSLTKRPIYAGWLPNKASTKRFKAVNPVPYFRQAAKHLAGTGAGKRAFLWKYMEAVTKKPVDPHDQGIGDCVSQGWGLGVDILDCVQIAHGRGEWKTTCATEPIYAGGRVEIGKGQIIGDGMHGTWAADWCRLWGILLRQAYLDGKYDFTNYSGAKARRWAHICRRCTEWGGGVPDELEPFAKEHPVKTTTLVKTWEEARDAVCNGYPVAICSNVGFKSERDVDGFAQRDGKWYHCMLLAGVDDSIRRSGGLMMNSWGPDWISGPTRFDQPTGSFWADASVIDHMLSQEDSFALSTYIGYPRQHLDYHLY
jgi:hypothetical protein